jgi:hypothetical protein
MFDSDCCPTTKVVVDTTIWYERVSVHISQISHQDNRNGSAITYFPWLTAKFELFTTVPRAKVSEPKNMF